MNEAGGIAGAVLELVVRDTAGAPAVAEEAVSALAALGVAAIAGEYHSVSARAAAGRAEALGLPFLCSSAVLDGLTDRPAARVARLAAPQSRGWSFFANYLLELGRPTICVVTQPSPYWSAGIRILRDRVETAGGRIVELNGLGGGGEICARLRDSRCNAVLILTGYPDPAIPIVRAIRGDEALAQVLIGAPAGQPELPGWHARLGPVGAGIPFLRYLPEPLSPLGLEVTATLAGALGEPPSFVALEGYDAILVLAEWVRTGGFAMPPAPASAAWDELSVSGTRGPISFSRSSGSMVAQWADCPLQIVDRDPGRPERFRVLRSA